MNKRKEYFEPQIVLKKVRLHLFSGSITGTVDDQGRDAEESIFVFDESADSKTNSFEPFEYTIETVY